MNLGLYQSVSKIYIQCYCFIGGSWSHPVVLGKNCIIVCIQIIINVQTSGPTGHKCIGTCIRLYFWHRAKPVPCTTCVVQNFWYTARSRRWVTRTDPMAVPNTDSLVQFPLQFRKKMYKIYWHKYVHAGKDADLFIGSVYTYDKSYV